MPFEIIRNDITKVKADAIVNTANPEPEIGGGTDWAIHAAAGEKLLAARKRIGAIEVGRCAATPAFALPARYVLHTVSPAWIDGRHGEEALLREAYDSALKLAAKLRCRSVAFPLMAAGTYGFPHETALSVAIRAFTDFLLKREMQIYLVLFNAEAFDKAGALFDDLKSYIDDRYVDERTAWEYRVDAAPNVSARGDLRRREAGRRQQEERVFDACAAAPPSAANPAPQWAESAPLAAKKASRPAASDEKYGRPESSFSEYLLELLKQRSGKDSEVYKRAEVSKQLFSKILHNRDYQPTKSTAIQLAIGLQLDLEGTQKLLGKAGYALTRSSRADLAVQYYIERKIYSVSFINEALSDCGLPLLKTGLKA
ncbi:MAG: macro domain-containing protein [Oscillospiraceae bacterium]|nr:macro domain-containing protein [Oscillospiraceae bacterium]